MAIKCGSCGERHETVAEVRQCSAGANALNRDIREASPVRTEREATPRMEAFVRDLARTRDMSLADQAAARNPELSFAEARRLIETYKDARRVDRSRTEPAPQRGSAPLELTDGIYRNPASGDIFKVYHTVHGANVQVAKRLRVFNPEEQYVKIVRGKETVVKAEFIYEGKAPLAELTPEMKMTLEEAKKYGAVYGVCIRCAATLTREESIERAMGPVCAGKANWA